MKTIFTSKRSIGMFALLVMGILFIVLPHSIVYPTLLMFIGVVICLDGIVKLTFLNIHTQGKKEFVYDLLEGILDLVLGVVIVKFYKYEYVTCISGVIYAIIPILRIIFSRHKLNQFVVDILKYLALIVLISSIERQYTTRIVVSTIFFSVAVIIFITLLVKIRNERRGVANELKNQS